MSQEIDKNIELPPPYLFFSFTIQVFNHFFNSPILFHISFATPVRNSFHKIQNYIAFYHLISIIHSDFGNIGIQAPLQNKFHTIEMS